MKIKKLDGGGVSTPAPISANGMYLPLSESMKVIAILITGFVQFMQMSMENFGRSPF